MIEGTRVLRVEPRATLSVSVDALLPRFADPSYAYRFGPPPHDLVVATLRREDQVLARAITCRSGSRARGRTSG